MIAIFGGSFDPPHKGHEKIIRAFLLQFPDCELFYIIPASLNPHKTNKHANSKQILEMLRLLIEPLQNEKIKILPYELQKAPPSYTIDTLRYIESLHPNETMMLVLGDDHLEKFHTWKDHEKIIQKCRMVIAPREHDLVELKNMNFELLDMKVMNISSTDIRNLVKMNRYTEIERIVPNSIHNYISLHQLYQSGN